MDDERIYDDEPEMEQQEEETEYDGEDSDLIKLLDFLVRSLEEGSSVPLTGKRLVNVDLCLDIVDDIRKNLPESVQLAQQVLDQKERIIAGAEEMADAKMKSADARANSAIVDATKQATRTKEEAEDKARAILKDAEARAEAMVADHEITRRATEEAARITESARADANDQKLAVADYADSILHELDMTLQDYSDAVKKSRQNLGRRKAQR